MELKTQIGSFTTVEGIRYTVRERSYPKTKTCWDGGAAGGVIYPAKEDTDRVTGRNPYKHSTGFWVGVGGYSGGKSFPDFVTAALFAQQQQRKHYERHKAFCKAFEAQTSPAIDTEAFNAFWSQNQTLGFKEAREQFRALVKEGKING